MGSISDPYDVHLICQTPIHTTMNNLATVQIRQPIEHTFSNLSEHFLASSAAELLNLPVYTV